MTGTNFSNWYNQPEGTFYAKGDSLKTTGAAPFMTAQVSGGNDRHQIAVFTNTAATLVGGVTQVLIGTNTNQSAKVAYAYKTNDFATSTNGGSVSTDTVGTVPINLTLATIGKFDFGGGASISGHIQEIVYYPRRLSNAELQGLTV
jgi:hypothetical protein